MQYDYKKMFEESGFLFPVLEETYDEGAMMRIIDRRKLELQKILRVAMNGLKMMERRGSKLIFKTKDQNIYEIEVEKDKISCRNMIKKTNQTNKEFILEKEGSSYVFERLIEKEESMLLIKVYLPKPDYSHHEYAIVLGFDKEGTALFNRREENTKVKSKLEAFRDFLESTGIKPDLERKIIVTNTNFHTYFKEFDLSDQKEIEVTKFGMSYFSYLLYPLLESYIRARKYSQELKHLKGLMFSVEKELRQYLNRNKIT